MWTWLRFAPFRIGSSSVRYWTANCVGGDADLIVRYPNDRACSAHAGWDRYHTLLVNYRGLPASVWG